MNKLVLLLMVSLFCSMTPILSKYQIPPMSQHHLDRISESFEVLKNKDRYFEAIVPQPETERFLHLAPKAKLLVRDISAMSRLAYRKSRALLTEVAGYHSLSEVQNLMRQMADTHPDIAQFVQYGATEAGRPLTALRLGAHLSDGVATPRLMLTAATHGDEIITTEVLLSLMNTMISQYTARNPRFVKMLQSREILFIPVVNVDGFSEQNRYDGNQDPNRSYPFPGQSQAKPSASIAAELELIARFPIAGSIDFHAYSGVVMYPWGYTHDQIPAEPRNFFAALTAQMAATNGYQSGSIADVMYIAKGSSCDYFYWKFQTRAIAIEMGDDKSPPPSAFPKYIRDQEESTWIFIESAL